MTDKPIANHCFRRSKVRDEEQRLAAFFLKRARLDIGGQAATGLHAGSPKDKAAQAKAI